MRSFTDESASNPASTLSRYDYTYSPDVKQGHVKQKQGKQGKQGQKQ